MTKRFTGWHMLALMLGMFGVIIGVNFVMASNAIATFGGTVVDNSYVAGQRYNGWLADAERQRALGWELAVQATDERRIEIQLNGRDGPLPGAQVTATATHPLGRTPPREISFAPGPDGSYRSQEVLPAGRWKLGLTIRNGTDTARYLEEVTL
jgi:nitrogen fixation protein FixH